MTKPTRVAVLAVFLTLGSLPARSQTLQYTSASGIEYRSTVDPKGLVAVLQAEDALAAAPDNVELMVAAGTALAGVRQMREAIDVFTKGLAAHPNSAVLYRWRGHRYLSIREFGRAERDLERGLELDPNLYGILYHLGIVRYAKGDFDGAAEMFRRALPLAPNGVELSGSTDWQWMALSRAGRHAEAKALLDARPDTASTGAAYDWRLKLYRGEITPEEALAGVGTEAVNVATVSYGIGNWFLVRGDKAEARTWFERSIAASDGWPAFGFILSEVDLARVR